MGKSTINNIYERDEFGLKNSLCESGIFCLEAALGGDDYGTYAAMASSLKVRRPGWGARLNERPRDPGNYSQLSDATFSTVHER